MACYQCNGCGKCELGRVFNYRPLNGACPVCRHENPADALVCGNCGMSLPKPPGSPAVPLGAGKNVTVV